MFLKKSKVSHQNKMKESLLKDVNSVLYKLEKGQFHPELSKESIIATVKDIRTAYYRLQNSIGTGDENITIGCENVRKGLDELQKASKANLLGRFDDCAYTLIEDLNEIVDLENGLIAEISTEIDRSSKKQKQYQSKLLEIEAISQEFNTHRNRVETDISKIERDKAELDAKLLEESNPRLKQNIFRQIKAAQSNISTLHVKSNQYSSCYSLIDSIKIYAKELVEVGDLSSIELDKAKIILNINRIRLVLDDPSKLQPLLNAIEKDLKKTQDKTKERDSGINLATGLNEDSFEEMNAYQNALIQEKREKEAIFEDVADLDSALKQTKKD